MGPNKSLKAKLAELDDELAGRLRLSCRRPLWRVGTWLDCSARLPHEGWVGACKWPCEQPVNRTMPAAVFKSTMSPSA